MNEILQQVLIVSAGVILSPVVFAVLFLVGFIAVSALTLLGAAVLEILLIPYRMFKDLEKGLRDEKSGAV